MKRYWAVDGQVADENDKDRSHHPVIPVFLNGTASENMPPFLKSIYAFQYQGTQDASHIQRPAEQMLERHLPKAK